jgi:hypothetical protein
MIQSTAGEFMIDREKQLARVLIAMAAVSLGACGGGGDDDDDEEFYSPPVPTVAPIAGIWSGTATSVVSQVQMNAVLLADESGDALMRVSIPGTGGVMIRGDACCETSGSGTAEAFYIGVNGALPVNISLSMSNNSLTGSFTLENNSYNFNLSRSSIYTQSTSLQTIAGTYTRQLDAGFAITITISSTGEITGSDSAGCVYNGQLTLPRPDRTLFRVSQLTVSNCSGPFASFNGSYTGLATLSPETAGGPLNALVWHVTGQTSLPIGGPVRN